MINFVIDLSEVENISGGMEVALMALQASIPAQLMFIQATWLEAVQGRVFPGMSKAITDNRYAAAISEPQSLQYPFNGDEFAGALVCMDGPLALRIENGYASFDMKPGLLAGPNAKTTKEGGRYNVIPFVHSTPGTTGQKGAPMPTDIYSMAKKLGAGQALKLQGPMAGYGIRSKVPSQVNAQAILRNRPAPMTATGYTWKVSPYEGMKRTAKAGHTTYQTFRAVSDKSDSNSWIHPGMAPNPIIAAVGEYVAPKVIDNITRAVLEALA